MASGGYPNRRQRLEDAGRRLELARDCKLNQDIDYALVKTGKRSSAAIFTLPDEVLLLILETAYTHDFPHCRNVQLCETCSPITFSHVCRRFKRVSLMSSKVWTCIHIALGQPANFGKIIATHLANSRNLPLNVTFQYVLAPPYHTTDAEPWAKYKLHCNRAMTWWNIALLHHHRWKGLAVFFATMDTAIPYVNQLATCELPLLESLYAWVDKRCTAEPVHEGGILLPTAPRLTTLSLCTELFEVVSPPALQNVSKLALARGWKEDVIDLTDMLSYCAPSLTYLEVTGDCNFEIGDEVVQTVYLPHLRHLLIHFARDEIWHTLLSVLDAPDLESLVVEDEESLNGFVAAIQDGAQHFPKLRYLSISHMEEQSSQALHGTTPLFLRSFPALTHLKIRTQSCQYGVMRQILCGDLSETDEDVPPSTALCPNLRTLILEGPKADEDALIRFAQRQTRNTKSFKTIRLQNPGPMPLSPSTVKSLTNMGITIVFQKEGTSYRFDAYNWNSAEFIPWDESVFCYND
ncbi:hypothetical protein BDW22DRAFT_1430060 [Trametopsis cervina]|nr:hypothetical protein BDW22DRAFT_1430060 [Trametopsis cervina]